MTCLMYLSPLYNRPTCLESHITVYELFVCIRGASEWTFNELMVVAMVTPTLKHKWPTTGLGNMASISVVREYSAKCRYRISGNNIVLYWCESAEVT
jgi:hypothetical protein